MSLPACTRTEPVDIGHGVTVVLSYVGGELDSVEYTHTCNGAAGHRDSVPVRPAWKDGWDVRSVSPLTLSPSLRCRLCGHHGFVTEGRWIPA